MWLAKTEKERDLPSTVILINTVLLKNMLGIAAVVFFVSFGAACIVLAVFHEVSWWKRRNWRRFVGRINGFDRESSDTQLSFSPEIEYEIDGKTHTFTSKYGEGITPSLSVGDEVHLLASPDGAHAEHYTAGNRIGFTLVPLAFGALFILVSLTMKPQKNAEQGADDQLPARAESKAE
ncbi:DUF3592 domain-containing protein [bacterium]|nr:DUF3592 domain-containing protein [bacterium]